MGDVFNYSNLIDQIKQAVEKQLELVIPEFAQRVKAQIEERYTIAMQEFYGAYVPVKYVRRGSLYDLLNIEINAKGRNTSLQITFDEFYSDNDGVNLFPIVFEQGFHGGREPNYTYWGNVPAFQSTSPLELLIREINKYATYAAQFDFEAVWSKYSLDIKL